MLLVLANVFNLLDIASTLIFLELGINEGNPAMVWLLERSVAGFVLIKAGGVLAVTTYCYFRGVNKVLVFASVVYAAAAFWNLTNIYWYLGGGYGI